MLIEGCGEKINKYHIQILLISHRNSNDINIFITGLQRGDYTKIMCPKLKRKSNKLHLFDFNFN